MSDINEILDRPLEMLVVDDSPGHVRLVREAVRKIQVLTNLQVVQDGEEALRYLRRIRPYAQARRPDIVLLDLHLPSISGFEVLAQIRSDSNLGGVYVSIVSTSESEQDIQRAQQLGANRYLIKPVNGQAIESVLEDLGSWLETQDQPQAEMPPAAEVTMGAAVMVIEDNPGDASLLRKMISRSQQQQEFTLSNATSLEEGLLQLHLLDYRLLLLDLGLPDSSGIATLRMAQRAAPQLAIVVLTGLEDEAIAIDAVRQGAQDYLVKGQVEGPVLVRAMRYAIQRKQLEQDRERLVQQLQQALASIKRLSGLLPICAHCKRIRNDTGYWEQIESYIRDHAEVKFSHGICPDCMQEIYPELFSAKK